MAGQFTLTAKIFGCPDKSRAEEQLPELVHGHARGQWTTRQSQGYDAPIGRPSNGDRIILQNSPLVSSRTDYSVG